MAEVTPFNITDDIIIGPGHPLTILAGPCVLEEQSIVDEVAGTMKDICARLGVNYIYKSSFDKANRTSIHSFRGPGLEKGIEQFKLIKERHNVPIVSDVHEASQCAPLAEVVDILQIPAFLCRQTDLLLAAAATGKTLNIKKGQFMAPGDMASVLTKMREVNHAKVALCERGTTFGYNNLVVDMRGLQIMRELGAPIIFDATHSVQLPGGQGTKSGGQPEFIPALSRAAAAVGIDGVFMEVHPEPSKALSDAANTLRLSEVEENLKRLVDIHRLVNS